jgi:DNA-binding MarR family transcriptional regulator
MPARDRTGTGRNAPGVEPHWLDAEEMATWLPLLRVVQLLPQALDKQLRDQAGVNHTYYMILAMLSEQADRRLAMGELARLTATSQSRLTHAVTSLEQRGWVTRVPCPSDKRVQYAQLTDAGFAVLQRVAPGHVDEVRRLVFDRLDRDEVSQLNRIARKLLVPLDG